MEVRPKNMEGPNLALPLRPGKGKISGADVAHFMLTQMKSMTYSREHLRS